VEALLPEGFAALPFEAVTRELLKALNETQKVRGFLSACQQDVDMVWHEAVREKLEPVGISGVG
ncbi:MAG TPA: hypothetical protein VFP77_13800, partial [Gemmatimonadaceae bacterium]|nr:hypothetical protein [Gemmatimonadaceae bacterium]